MAAIEETRAVAVRKDQLAELMAQARAAVNSGMLPKGVDRPEKALAIMLRGREIGVQPMVALGHIFAINGSLMLSACLTEALLKKAGYRIMPLVVTAEEARIKFVSPQGDEFVYAVTWEEAQAGKWNVTWNKEKGQWEEKPAWRNRKVMLYNRAMTQGAKMFAGDALLLPPVDEDGSMLVYDPEDAEYVDEEEAANRERLRERDRALILERPAGGRGRLFKTEPAGATTSAPAASAAPDGPVEEAAPAAKPPAGKPGKGWTQNPAERAELRAFLARHGLPESEAKAIAGLWLGRKEPLERFADFPFSREILQRVLLAWLQINRPWSDPDTHWIETDPKAKARFWATVGAEGFDEVQVHSIIPSLHRWPGTCDEAIDFVLYSTPEDRQFPEPDAAEAGDAGEGGPEVLL